MGKGIYQTLRLFAKEVELRWPVEIMIVHNQIDMQIGGFEQRTYYFYIAPQGNQDRTMITALAEEIRAEAQSRFDVLSSPFCLQFGIFELNRWLAYFSEDPMRDARGMSRFSPSMWSPLVYGEKLMSSIITEVKRQFGDNIIERLRTERKRWHNRLKAWRRRSRKRLARIHTERTTPLNRLERSLIEEFLKIIEELHLEGRTCLVGLDGSGRPLALAAQWYLEAKEHNDVATFFIDPHQLKLIGDDLSAKQMIMKSRFSTALEQENPTLFELFTQQSELVILIEDQIGYGNQSRKLKMFLDYLAGEETKARLVCLSGYSDETPPPSWWKKKTIQGIKLVPNNKVSLTSKEHPTNESDQFYTQLKEFACHLAKKRKRRKTLPL